MLWFSSDLHIGHTNIIKYCSRPFSNCREMGIKIVDNFNSIISPGDSLYLLGDIGWSQKDTKWLVESLNCKQIYVIWGNHDDRGKITHKKIAWSGDLKYLKIKEDNNLFSVVLSHYPFRSWRSQNYGSFHLYGHCHGHLPGIGRSMDVGVDTNNFFPYNWEEIKEKLLKIPVRMNF